MFARFSLSNASKFLVPAAATAAAIGSAYHFSSSSILNETKKTFKGDDWIDLKLKRSQQVSSDTKHFWFELNSPEDVSGLVVASCVLTKYVTPKGSNVIRPYTPISPVDEKGEVEFCIKRYPEGKMGNHIFDLKDGDTLAFKGPIVKYEYKPNSSKEIILIGGGSGITPLYQLARHILTNDADKTNVKLFYGNKTQEDILIKKEIDGLAQKFPDQFKVTYFLDKAPDGWKGKTGFITKDFLKEQLPAPSQDGTRIFVCGPPPLYNAISGNKVSPQDQGELSGALAELGYSKDQVYKY